MKKMEKLFRKDVVKQFTRFTIPAVVAMVVSSLYTILDGVFVGQGIGQMALGAINIVFPFIMFNIAFSMLIGVGGSNLYSFLKGRGEKEKANNLFCQCFCILLGAGALLSILSFVFREQFCRLLGADDELLPMATRYMTWIAPFVFVQITGLGISVFIRNDNAPKLAMTGAVVGSLVNAVLDYVLLIVLHKEIEWAAITNGIGMTIELVFYLSHFVSKKGDLRIKKPRYRSKEVRAVFKNGFSSFLMEFSAAAVSFSFNLVIIARMGAVGVSAYSIVIYICTTFNYLLIGVSQGAQPIMSLSHGRGDERTLKEGYRLGSLTNFVLSILMVTAAFAFGRQLVSLFGTQSAEISAAAVKMLRIYALAYIPIGLSLMNVLYFQTTENNLYSTIVSFLRSIGFVQLCLLILPPVFGIAGIFLSHGVGEGLNFGVSIVLKEKVDRKGRKPGKKLKETIA